MMEKRRGGPGLCGCSWSNTCRHMQQDGGKVWRCQTAADAEKEENIQDSQQRYTTEPKRQIRRLE